MISQKYLISALLCIVSLQLFSQGNPLILARVAIEKDNFEVAANKLDIYLINNPSDKQAIFLSAVSNLELGNYTKSIEQLKKLKITYHEDITLMDARINAGLGNSKLAIALLDKYLNSSIKRPEKEIRLIKEFNSLKGQDWDKLWEKERYSKKELLFIDALYAVKSGKKAEAKERLEEFLSKYTRLDRAYYLLAQILYEIGDYKTSIQNCEKAIELKPVLDYKNLKADCLVSLKKSKKALSIYDEILNIDSLYIKAYQGRAQAYHQLQEYDNAENDIEKYRHYYPESVKAKSIYAKITSSNGDYLNAISTYGNLINENPQNSEYFIGRADSYMKTKTYEHAIKDYAMALDINPKNIEIYKKKAKAHKLLGEIEQACAEWKYAAKFGDIESQKMLYKYCK